MKVSDIRNGDTLTYRNGRIHSVNHSVNYKNYYDEDFNHLIDHRYDIMKIERYNKVLFFYLKKVIYEKK